MTVQARRRTTDKVEDIRADVRPKQTTPLQSQRLHYRLRLLLSGLAAVVIALSAISTLTGQQSHVPAYQRYNFYLNNYFIKIRWVYTTTLWILSGFQLPFLFIVSSAAWYFTTQSVLGGPSLFDFLYTASGGGCQGDLDEKVTVLNKTTCKVAGGEWIGGHDSSGHIFIIVHCLLFTYVLFHVSHRTSPLILNRQALVVIMGMFTAIDLYMLITTSLFFHTFWEKFSGMVAVSVYWLVTTLWLSLGP